MEPQPLGTEYYVPFTSNGAGDQKFRLLLTAFVDATVTITTPPGGDPVIRREVTVRPGVTTGVTLPSDIMDAGTGLPIKTLYVKASGPVAINTASIGSCSSHAPLNVANLGVEYYATTWPTGATGTAQLTVMATDATTKLTVYPSVTVTYNGLTYTAGMSLTVQMEAMASLVLTSSSDLSGTQVAASRPVVVISGGARTSVGSGSLTDQMETQLLPVRLWGDTYPMAPFPGATAGYYIKVTAQQDGTIVRYLRRFSDR